MPFRYPAPPCVWGRFVSLRVEEDECQDFQRKGAHHENGTGNDPRGPERLKATHEWRSGTLATLGNVKTLGNELPGFH